MFALRFRSNLAKILTEIDSFRSDYRMPVHSLSVFKYGWWRRPWRTVVAVISTISAEWRPEVYTSALIHSLPKFPQKFSHIQALCLRVVDWTSHRDEVTSRDLFTGTCSSRSMALSIEDGLFSIPSKCSALLPRIVFSDMNLVLCALGSKEPALVGPQVSFKLL